MSVRDRIKRMEQMAMQEKEAAPDERGRSPGGVSMASNTSASGSPRPLSKVRTSFVAIADKEGRIGLHRQPSGDSSISERKLSGDTDAASSILQDSSRSNVFTSSPDALRSERNRGPSGSFSRSAIQDPGAGAGPTSAAPPTTSPSSGPASRSAISVADPKPSTTATTTGSTSGAPGTTVDTKASATSTPTGPVPASTRPIVDPASRAVPASGPVSDSSLASGWGQKGLAASPQIRKASRGEEAAAQRPSGRKSGQGVQESEAQPARDQSQAQAKRSENSFDRAGNKDSSSGGPGATSGNSRAGATALNGADKTKTTKPAPTSSSQPKQAGKAPEAKGTTTPAAEKKPTEKKATPANVSPPFVKPRPKSPTQPDKLPERLTTHTGASAAKSKNAPPPVRPASRTSMGTSGKGLGRSSSVTGRQHSSFGPPPKQAVDHPVLKKESKVDEGFLARMMRPTQAYANKVADKVQMPPKTPPRATANKKPASVKTAPAKKVVPRSTTTSAAASPETSKTDQTSAAKHAAKREDPIAEEPIVAKKAEEKPAPVKSVASSEKTEAIVKNSKKEGQVKASLEAPEKKVELSKPNEAKVEASKPAEEDNISKVVESKTEAPKSDVHNVKSKKEGDILKTSEEKASTPPTSNKTADVPKSVEKAEGLPEVSSEKKDDLLRDSDQPTSDEKSEPLQSPDETPETTSGSQASEPKNGIPKAAEMDLVGSTSENALIGKKNSDAMLATFMNPGPEKADASQADGIHKEEDKTSDPLGNREAGARSFQPTTNNLPATALLAEKGQEKEQGEAEEEEEW